MEKTYDRGEHDGYKLGESIEVHSHIKDPESWFLTIMELEIFGKSLCLKTCTKPEIARYIMVEVNKKRLIVDNLIIEIAPFTSENNQ